MEEEASDDSDVIEEIIQEFECELCKKRYKKEG
jgi:hypothetical protein